MPDRLQQEIEELLARLDTLPPRRSRWSRIRGSVGGAFGGVARGISSIRLPHINPGTLLLAAIIAIVVAYLFDRGDSDITRWVITGGIVVFIVAFILSLRKHSRPPEKRWRGQPVDLRGPGVSSRLRSWWGRHRTHR